MNSLKKGDRIAVGKYFTEFDCLDVVSGQTMIKATDGCCYHVLLVDKIINEEVHRERLKE